MVKRYEGSKPKKAPVSPVRDAAPVVAEKVLTEPPAGPAASIQSPAASIAQPAAGTSQSSVLGPVSPAPGQATEGSEGSQSPASTPAVAQIPVADAFELAPVVSAPVPVARAPEPTPAAPPVSAPAPRTPASPATGIRSPAAGSGPADSGPSFRSSGYRAPAPKPTTTDTAKAANTARGFPTAPVAPATGTRSPVPGPSSPSKTPAPTPAEVDELPTSPGYVYAPVEDDELPTLSGDATAPRLPSVSMDVPADPAALVVIPPIPPAARRGPIKKDAPAVDAPPVELPVAAPAAQPYVLGGEGSAAPTGYEHANPRADTVHMPNPLLSSRPVSAQPKTTSDSASAKAAPATIVKPRASVLSYAHFAIAPSTLVTATIASMIEYGVMSATSIAVAAVTAVSAVVAGVAVYYERRR